MSESASQLLSSAHLPDLSTLTAGLTAALIRNGFAKRRVTVLARTPNVYTGTYPTELIQCQIDGQRELTLLCKYEDGHPIASYGHRGGIAYEAEVYRTVLAPLQMTTPAWYGTQCDEATGQTFLIVEYLANTLWVAKDSASSLSSSMQLAARWIGQFHAINEQRLFKTSIPFLTTYDAIYYRGWVARAVEFAGPLHRRFPWFQRVCDRTEEWMALLLAPPVTIIHGEFYQKNVLLRDGTIYPVDWQSAAIASGEIDLAALVERWPAAIARACEDAYQRARWPDGAPTDFLRRLDAARVYLQFRWLGDRPEWTTDEACHWRFEPLRLTAMRLGLI